MIRRVVSAVTTLLIAWLGLLAPTASALAIPDRAELTSTHASHHHPGRVTDAISERGPPVTHDRTVSVHSAADRWSRGASVLPDGLTRPSINAYDATAGFVSTARGNWITEERVGRAMPALVVVDRSIVAANGGKALTRYDPDFALGQLTSGGRASASQLDEFGAAQGWIRSQTATGPVKYADANGVVRLTIKRGSPRAPGSGGPHVELRNADGYRVDPYGNLVTRKSPGNHTPIEWDW